MPKSPASGSKQEKTMSSRLLTMKFMQRAAATAASKEPSQPASKNESNIPTPKRPRLSTGPAESPATTQSSDLEQISAALAAEEEKRREAVARQAAEAGESEWFLDFGTGDALDQYAQPPLVLADTSVDADDDDMVYGGRQSYGNFRRKNKPKHPNQTANNERNSEDDEDDDADVADPDNVDAMINKAKKQAQERNRPQQVKLSKLTSISGGRHSSVGGGKPQKKRKHK